MMVALDSSSTDSTDVTERPVERGEAHNFSDKIWCSQCLTEWNGIDELVAEARTRSQQELD